MALFRNLHAEMIKQLALYCITKESAGGRATWHFAILVLIVYPNYTFMPIESQALILCPCAQFSDRLQLMHALTGSVTSESTKFLVANQLLIPAQESPQWLLLTSNCLLSETSALTSVWKQWPDIRNILCVLPGAPAPATLWPLIEQAKVDVLCTLTELAACLTAAIVGRHYPSALAADYASLATAAPAPPALAKPEPAWEQLSTAEQRVLREILQGHGRQQIAEILFLSPRTVDNHRAHIADKLNAGGGPGSLGRFMLLHKSQLTALLNPDS